MTVAFPWCARWQRKPPHHGGAPPESSRSRPRALISTLGSRYRKQSVSRILKRHFSGGSDVHGVHPRREAALQWRSRNDEQLPTHNCTISYDSRCTAIAEATEDLAMILTSVWQPQVRCPRRCADCTAATIFVEDSQRPQWFSLASRSR